jgi:hypothetical protein
MITRPSPVPDATDFVQKSAKNAGPYYYLVSSWNGLIEAFHLAIKGVIQENQGRQDCLTLDYFLRRKLCNSTIVISCTQSKFLIPLR